MTLSAQTINTTFKNAIALQKKGKFRDSITPLQRVAQMIPHHFAAWNALGEAFTAQNQNDKALLCFQESLRWCPEFYPASINLARHYLADEQSNQALTIATGLLSTYPKLPDTHLLLSEIYEKLNIPSKYIFHLKSYVEHQTEVNNDPNTVVKVDLNDTYFELDFSIPPILSSANNEQQALQLIDQNLTKWLQTEPCKELPTKIPNSIFYLAYYQTNPKTYLERLSQVFRHLYPAINYKTPYCLNLQKKSKPKIGIVTGYLDKFHAISLCFSPLIKALSEHYTFVYFRIPIVESNLRPIDIKERLGKIKIVDLSSNVKKSQEIVTSQKVDILWYTDINMTKISYLLAHARLAPIQCVSAGHPCTTGISTIDHFISSSWLEGENWSERYTENLIKLPTFPVIYEDYEIPEKQIKKSDFNLPDDKNIYFCAQTLFKVHPDMDDIFLNILEQDPNAVIIFSYAGTSYAELLKQRLEKKLGTLIQRCQFIELIHQHLFFELLNCVDVILDTSPFGGGNTVCQSISVGTPTVSFASHELRGSGASGIYRLIEISECIANTPKEYVDLTLKLGTDKDYRSQISSKILQNKHLLFNQNDKIIEAYRSMFNSFITGADQT